MKKSLMILFFVMVMVISVSAMAMAETLSSFCWQASYGESVANQIEKDVQTMFAGTMILQGTADSSLINGQKTAKISMLKKGSHLLVPVRLIAESFGADVAWDGKTKLVTIDAGDRRIKLKQHGRELWLNDATVTLPVEISSIADTTYVPLEAMAAALDKTVAYQEAAQMVVIQDKGAVWADFAVGVRLAQVLLADGNIIYFDASNVIYKKDEKIYLLSGNAAVGELLETYVGYEKRPQCSYLITGYQAAMGGNKIIYELPENGTIKPLWSGQISSYVLDAEGRYLYIVIPVWGEAVITPEARADYSGNLLCLDLVSLAQGEDTEATYLGKPGFVYGLSPTWQDVHHPDPQTDSYRLFDQVFTPFLEGAYLYLNGVAFLPDMAQAKDSYGLYKIPVEGRSHEKIESPDK